jgi:flagellar motor switch protein FliN
VASLNRDIVEQVVEACSARQAEIAEAIGAAFGVGIQVSVATSGPFDRDQLPNGCRGPGLALILHVGGESILLAIPESSGWVQPDWRQMDRPPAESLTVLTKKLGELLIPAPLTTDRVKAVYVSSLESAIGRSELASEASHVALQIQSGDRSGTATMIWPLMAADVAFIDRSGKTPPQSPRQPETAKGAEHQDSPGGNQPRVQYHEVEDGLTHLPCYSRSLLKIKVPVMVTLAESKQPVENVLNIGPGSIIHFNKPCEDTLTLEVSGQKIAVGEAVKVGDKFGLWITAMILPEERFWVISNRSVAERAK